MSDTPHQTKGDGQGLYRSPAIKPPSVEKLKGIASEYDLQLTDVELQGYAEVLSQMTQKYAEIDALPDPVPVVKYPRTPGYRPDREENQFNAWTYKTVIEGAPEGKLKGRTIVIKDSIAVAGVPMSSGSRLLQGYIPEFDATVVTRVLDAGGRITGKAVCEDMCLCINSFTAATGPIHNPHNNTKSAGGSSSGSAVLVATGEVDMALGGDQGGSIRVPASNTGIVRLKPTFGLVPYTGACSMEMRLDTLGPMARTVHDCALLLEVLAGYDDGLDPRQFRDIQVPDYTAQLTGDLTGLTIGTVKEGFLDAEPDVAKLVHQVASKLETLGAVVKEISIPMHSTGLTLASEIYGQYSNMFDNKGVTPGLPGFQPTSLLGAMHDGIKLRAKDAQPTVKAFILFGEYLKQNYGHRLHCKGVNLNRVVRQAFDDALKSCDVLVMPTTPLKARQMPPDSFGVAELVEAGGADMKNTRPINMTGHPALSVCAGFSQGLPVGIMVVGKHFDDATVLRVGHGVEKVREGVNSDGKISNI